MALLQDYKRDLLREGRCNRKSRNATCSGCPKSQDHFFAT
jgi:hypothetical protein